jgi:hypothetical protein
MDAYRFAGVTVDDPLVVAGRPVRELQPCMRHIEQHGPVNLCGSLCQPHAIYS